MISFSPGDNRVQMDSADSPKKPNYDLSETKVKGEDYTRPSMSASQTEDEDFRADPVEEGYEVHENQKNPERNIGRPGIRVERFDSFAETGLPPEGIKVFEDDTVVLVDDGKKHGPRLKWQYSGGLEGKTGPKGGL